MKTIKAKIGRLAAANGLGLIAAIILLFNEATVSTIQMGRVFICAIIFISVLFGFLIREYGRYKAAKLIVENKIMRIQAAEIEEEAHKGSSTLSVDGIEVFISCFGVLIDSKVIKFNIEGVKLKRVEIRGEFICLTYGDYERTKTIRILHGHIGKQELQCLVERFHYETGIIPVVAD